MVEQSKISINNLADQIATSRMLQHDMIQDNKSAHSTQSRSLAKLELLASSSVQTLGDTGPQLTEICKHIKK
jgi:hypothetical protein